MPSAEVPVWVEEAAAKAGEISHNSRKDTWQLIAVVGEAVNAFPARSRLRKETKRLFNMTTWLKDPTLDSYARLWAALKEAAGGIENLKIPQNIKPSTARVIVQHGGDHSVIAQADAEGWTLAQARAWAANLTVVATDKPPTLWRWLTKAVSTELRRATGPVIEGELIQQVREAVRAWNEQAIDAQEPPA